MKINEIISEANIFKPVVNVLGKALTGSAAKIAAKNTAKAEKDLAYQANKDAIKSVAGAGIKGAIDLANLIGWGAIVYQNGSEIYKLNQQLKAGMDVDEYNKYLQYYLGKMVTQMVATKMVGGIFNKGGQIVGTVPFMSKLGEATSALSPAAKAAFVAWIANPMPYPAGGKEAFANWYAGETFMPEVANGSRFIFGNAAMKGWRFIEDFLGMDYPGKEGEVGNASGQAGAASAGASGTASTGDTPEMGSEPGAMQYDAKGRWINKPGYNN